MSDIHNNPDSTNIPHEHDCPIAELVSQCRTRFSDLGPLLKEDLSDNELSIYFDHETRFETWCYSFKVSDQTFDLTLRNSPVLSKVIFQLLDQILSLLVTAEQLMLGRLPERDKAAALSTYMMTTRHAIDKLFELSPAIESPAFARNPIHLDTYTKNKACDEIVSSKFDLPLEPVRDSVKASYLVLRDHTTTFLINNTVALRGWRWDLTGQLVYQSARRLDTNPFEPSKVRVLFSDDILKKKSGRAATFEEACNVFSHSIPNGDRLGTEILENYLDIYSNYNTTQPLNLILVTADGFSTTDMLTLERISLEVGKAMRFKGAQTGRIHIRIAQIGANPCISKSINSLRDNISQDKAIMGVIRYETLVLDMPFLSEHTYEKLLVGGIAALRPANPSPQASKSQKTRVPTSITVENLSSHTDEVFLERCFEAFGAIAFVEFVGKYTAEIDYERRDDAISASSYFNQSRFDGSIIDVHLTDRNLGRKEDREDDGIGGM